ncbi:Fc.00g081910.m01.CDS01 [Cosmosporella sp. VM-42]
MSTQERLLAALPLPKKVLEESFIDAEELAAKIRLGKHRDCNDASSATPKKRKRRGENEEGPAVKRSKEGSFRDSLPTPWKSDFRVEGPLRIMREERLVREEKYRISFNTSSQSINVIKERMFSKGWDLKYTTVSNSDDLIIGVPSEFGHSIQPILEDLKEILEAETETDLQDDTGRRAG